MHIYLIGILQSDLEQLCKFMNADLMDITKIMDSGFPFHNYYNNVQVNFFCNFLFSFVTLLQFLKLKSGYNSKKIQIEPILRTRESNCRCFVRLYIDCTNAGASAE